MYVCVYVCASVCVCVCMYVCTCMFVWKYLWVRTVADFEAVFFDHISAVARRLAVEHAQREFVKVPAQPELSTV